MAKTKTELLELETVEVSLVDKGANKRVFAIKKSEQEMKVIDAILGAPFEKSEELLERLTKAELSKQAVEGVKSAVQILSAFQEEIPAELMKELMMIAGLSKQEEEEEEEADAVEEPSDEEVSSQEEEEEEEEETEKQEEEEEEDEDKLEKRLAKLPKNVREMVSQLWKTNKVAVSKAAKLEAEIKKAKDEKRLGECISKARAEFSHLPVKAEELGGFIKSLDSSEDSEFVLKLLSSTNEMIANSEFTREIGKSTNGSGLSSIAKAEKMAEAMVSKGGITKERALANVWKTNPSLYAEYQQEKGS